MTLDTRSIATAVSLLEQRQDQKPSLEHAGNDPIDVVAVVAHRGVLTMQSPPLSSMLASPRADIYISDHSVSRNTTVKVSLHGLSEVTRTVEEQIVPGDVIRFNGLRLGPQHNPQYALRNSGYDALVHFEKTRDDPEPGYSWYRLGRIRIVNEEVFPRRAILGNDQRHKQNFPREMATSDQRIQDLVTWFPGYLLGDDTSFAPIPVGGETVLNSSTTESARSLSPLPCRRRSLAEIQSSSGMLSNILVHVTHCDSQVLPRSTTNPKKRPRASGSGTSHPRQILGFATVTDHSGVIMSLFDQGNRFGSIFQEALERKVLLSLTNVQSKKQCDIDGRPLASDEIVLWPTRTTAGSFLSSEETNSKFTGLTDLPDDNKVSATQQTQNQLAFHNTKEGISGRYMTIKSSIIGITVNGRNIDKNLGRWTPETLKTNLTATDSMNFEPAIIRLTALDGQEGAEEGVLAQGSIVESLCGGITPSEWSNESLARHSANMLPGRGTALKAVRAESQQICTMGYHALQLLCALVHEKIQLCWTIDMDTDPHEVVRVTLPSI
jgi:hypothetical protein